MRIEEWFKNEASRWGVQLSERQLEQFQLYYQLLIERNKQVNLTRITEKKEVYGKHFLDSLSLISMGEMEGKNSLIDVGTGAGFPSIPLKIALPELQVTLLDSLRKRIAFLEEVVTTLGLGNVTFVHGRAEDAARDSAHREAYDIATARAVAGLNVLSEYCLPFVRVGGAFIAMKAQQVDEEMSYAMGAIKKLGGRSVSVTPFELPDEMGERNLVTIQKGKPTPKGYPRKAGIPAKNPLL